MIEESPSSRARCAWCNNYIFNGEPRVKFYTAYENHSTYYCFHLKCFLLSAEGKIFFNNILNIFLPYCFSSSSEAQEHIKRLREISKIIEMSKSLGKKEI
jgi:hypothetical protein